MLSLVCVRTYHKYSNEKIPTFEVANCEISLRVRERLSQSFSASLDGHGFGSWCRRSCASSFPFIRHESMRNPRKAGGKGGRTVWPRGPVVLRWEEVRPEARHHGGVFGVAVCWISRLLGSGCSALECASPYSL